LTKLYEAAVNQTEMAIDIKGTSGSERRDYWSFNKDQARELDLDNTRMMMYE